MPDQKQPLGIRKPEITIGWGKERMAIEKVLAPILGKVVRCYVRPGDKVDQGDAICDLESMKMENPILSPVKGIVSELIAEPGKAVEHGDHLATIEY